MNHHLPQFSQIDLSQVEPTLKQMLKHNLDEINRLLSANSHFTWDNLMQPIDDLDNVVDNFWSPIQHLHGVLNSDSLRKAYEDCLPLLSEYGTAIGQNEKLFQAIKSLTTSAEASMLSAPQKKILKDEIRDFHLAGVDLPADKKLRYKEISKQLSLLTNKYENNVLDATDAWSKLITDEQQLAGIPETSISLFKTNAQKKSLTGYLLNLEIPCYSAVMSYADNAALREEIYKAYTTRASDQGPDAGKWDNLQTMFEILQLRHELAQILGFQHYAEKSLASKMAESPQQVLDFLYDLVTRSRSQAKQEYEALKAFTKQQFQMEKLNPWDLGYYSEKMRKHLYDISDEELRPYFLEDHVIAGMFAIVEKLYGIQVKERHDVDTWHTDVRFFEIFDENGALRAQFYVDLYARANKRGGAWMDECQARHQNAQKKLQLPVAFLTCNFSGPSADKPSLLTHDEVITLFHEFGHCLHHMLTTINFKSASGINGVPWDAVELPSQFFENWAWQKKALDLFAKHYQTGEMLPDTLFDKMIAARNFQAAIGMIRQLELSIFDFELHMNFDPQQGPQQIQQCLNRVREKVSIIPVPSFNRFQNTFGHIFAGGYAAGYYSYKWAEVLSSDAFGRFEEEGIFNEPTGRDFLHHILEKGGSEEPMDLFIQFRGRKPTIDALLRHNGITG